MLNGPSGFFYILVVTVLKSSGIFICLTLIVGGFFNYLVGNFT